MLILVNNQEFETNPSNLLTDFLFKGTVHTGTSLVETVYGVTEDEVISLAYQLKELNKDFNTVHLYNPAGEYIGVKFL